MEKGQGPPPQYSSASVTTTYPQATTSVMSCQVALGPHSQVVTCPSCHAQISTTVRAETSTKTHIIAALLCLVSCCCIPYCIDSCKSRNHYCPNCNAYIGAYQN